MCEEISDDKFSLAQTLHEKLKYYYTLKNQLDTDEHKMVIQKLNSLTGRFKKNILWYFYLWFNQLCVSYLSFHQIQ